MTTLISPPWANWYWIVNDSNPAAKVYSTASGAYVNNNAAAFLVWLADTNFGAASGLGSGIAITAAANNGSGKTRLTVSTTANVASGQYFYFGTNGAQQITVIDGTHIDLTGLAFGSYAATAAMQGATIIDTDANLRKHLNTVALRSNTAGANTVSGAVADITLTNPMPLYQNITFAVLGKKVILPPMNAPQSIPIGMPFIIEGGSFDVYYQDGTTKLTTLGGVNDVSSIGTEKVIFELISNATANGSIIVTRIPPNQGIPAINGILVQNDATTPNTKLNVAIGLNCWVNMFDVSGGGQCLGMYNQFGITVDAGLAGPAANGRDQSAAFGASQFLHLHAIGGRGTITAGILSTNSQAPTLPSGYTHSCYIGTYFWDASSHFLRFHQMDDRVSYDGRQLALNAGAATVDTAVSVSSLVPSGATDFDVNVESWGVTADGTGAAISVLHLGFLSGIDTHQLVTDFAVGPSTATRLPTGDITFPNISQQFYYHHQIVVGNAPAATIIVRSYRVPNGA